MIEDKRPDVIGELNRLHKSIGGGICNAHDFAVGRHKCRLTIGAEIQIERQKWYCLELHIKKGQGTGIFEGWVDGVKKWNYQGIYMGLQSIAYMTLVGVLNRGPAVNQYQWVDQFVVSDQRIGCITPQEAAANAAGVVFADSFESGDYSAGVVLLIRKEVFYILEVVHGRFPFDRLKPEVMEVKQRYGSPSRQPH